jgi:hypothetical protein
LYCCYSRRRATTLNSVGDQDWLEKGHGAGEGLEPMIKGSSSPAVDRASIRSVLRGTESPRPRASRRRNKALVGWLLYCATAVGGTAAAFTVRDTLFPSLGAPPANRVWPNPTTPDSTLATEHGSSTIAQTDTTTATTLVEATVAAAAQQVVAETTPTVASPAQGPGNSIDNKGPGNGAAPSPGTTVADNPTRGPGPGTTVDDHPTDTSTPSSASGPPSSADATATSTPTDPASSNSTPSGQNGKGSGKGGGGDDPPTP